MKCNQSNKYLDEIKTKYNYEEIPMLQRCMLLQIRKRLQDNFS